MKRLIPPATIGIIGGGQLGRMMALSALQTGYKIAVLDPSQDCPCATIADTFICAAYDDPHAFESLISQCDVATYEFENVDVDLVSKYPDHFPQGAQALRIAQHRLYEKQFAQRLDIPVPRYRYIQRREELALISEFPVLIKSCRFGYDGKSQWLIHNQKALDEIDLRFPNEYIAEEVIYFQAEISVVACRFNDGITVLEPFENRHSNGILREAIHPARISDEITAQAIKATRLIAESFDYYGVFAVEYFVAKEGILFNEIAPRPHNSAHATIEDSDRSQYDLHISAITGGNKVESHRQAVSMMVNILGQDLDESLEKYEHNHDPLIHFHLYGKKESKIDRKMGHLTICADSHDELVRKYKRWRTNE